MLTQYNAESTQSQPCKREFASPCRQTLPAGSRITYRRQVMRVPMTTSPSLAVHGEPRSPVFEGRTISLPASACVSPRGTGDFFLALEQHKLEQKDALQNMKREFESRLTKVEDTIHSVVTSTKNQSNHDRKELEDCLESAKKELVQKALELNDALDASASELLQAAQDVSTALQQAVSNGMLGTSETLSVRKASTSIPPNTQAGSSCCSTDSLVHSYTSIPPPNAERTTITSIPEENESDLNDRGASYPGSKSSDVIQISYAPNSGLGASSMRLQGQLRDLVQQEQQGKSLEGAALQYIMPNYKRLEDAAQGLIPEKDGESSKKSLAKPL